MRAATGEERAMRRPPPAGGGRRTARMLAAALAAVALAATAAGCTPRNSPRGVVDRFIEAHYMEINLKGAEPLCTGLALDKIREEERLTEGQKIDESTRKPTIHYKLKDKRAERGRVTYLFLATIDVPDGGSFEKKWMITARREGPDWKVSNFSEYD